METLHYRFRQHALAAGLETANAEKLQVETQQVSALHEWWETPQQCRCAVHIAGAEWGTSVLPGLLQHVRSSTDGLQLHTEQLNCTARQTCREVVAPQDPLRCPPCLAMCAAASHGAAEPQQRPAGEQGRGFGPAAAEGGAGGPGGAPGDALAQPAVCAHLQGAGLAAGEKFLLLVFWPAEV